MKQYLEDFINNLEQRKNSYVEDTDGYNELDYVINELKIRLRLEEKYYKEL